MNILSFIKWRIKNTRTRLSVFLAFYVGVLLNSSVFYRRLITNVDALGWFSILRFLGEVISLFSLTLALFLVLSLLGRWLFALIGMLVVLISVVASYYIVFSDIVIGYGVVASVLAINDDLSKESVGYFPIIWTLVLSAPAGIIIFNAIKKSFIYPKSNWNGSYKRYFLYLITAIVCGVLPLYLLGLEQKSREKALSIDLPSYGGVVAHSYLPFNWIASLGLYGYTQFTSLSHEQQLRNPVQEFTYTPPNDIDDLFLIVIIGETTRSDHMGILGYDRPTTPFLSQEKNLFAFPARSCDTATKLSLRCMFVREGGVKDDAQRTLKEENIFHVLKELGFSSDLFAMQSELWFYNLTNPDSFLLREMIATQKGNEGKRVDDMLLLQPLGDSLKKHPRGKHLVILHTKGSHYLYTERYPKDFAVYKPECHGIDSFCSKQELINSYDNSVLYVDKFIHSVINQVRDKKALVVYAADHGESIEENKHFHATPRDIAPDEQFRVPVVVWASDRFLQNNQNLARFTQLRNQYKKRSYRHEDLYDSILGCLGYTSPDGGINAKNNWCASSEGA